MDNSAYKSENLWACARVRETDLQSQEEKLAHQSEQVFVDIHVFLRF